MEESGRVKDLDALENTTALVRDVFNQVWTAFYEWETEYSRQKLQTLRLDVHSDPSPTASSALDRDFEIDDTLSKGGSAGSILVIDYVPGIRKPTPQRVAVDVVDVSGDLSLFEPFYESGPLAIRSIMTGDDPSAMKFIPFADDPSFDPVDNIDKHARFSWQVNFRNPDSQLFRAVVQTTDINIA